MCNTAAPSTGLQAKFSYRLIAAMARSGIDTGAIGSFSDITARDADLMALRDRVSVAGDDSLTEAQTPVVLTLTGGQEGERQHDLNAPITMARREVQLRQQAAGLRGEDRVQNPWRAVRSDTLEPLFQELARPKVWPSVRSPCYARFSNAVRTER